MAFNVNDLRSQLTGGGARSSLFQVIITNPANTTADLKVPFMVRAAALPESRLGTIELPYFGRRIKFAGDRSFEPWTVTVINDEDFLVRNAMESWMASINTHQGNITTYSSASPTLYKANAQIIQYSKTGKILREYTFNGLFPVDITSIGMDWQNENQIEEFQITFNYDWWSVTAGITGDAGTQA